MKIKDLPERLKDLAIMYMNDQGEKITEDSTVMDISWHKTPISDLWVHIDLYSKKQIESINKESLQQLRIIYPNDMEFGAVVAKLFLL
jgi:hypothetical protein